VKLSAVNGLPNGGKQMNPNWRLNMQYLQDGARELEKWNVALGNPKSMAMIDTTSTKYGGVLCNWDILRRRDDVLLIHEYLQKHWHEFWHVD